MALDLSTLPDIRGLTVGILGGTGDQGRGLAYRFALGGQRVLIGSRTADRAASAAAELAELVAANAGTGSVEGGDNVTVSQRSDVVIVAVPFEGHADTLVALAEHLVGKIVVDCVNPLGFDKQGPYALKVAEGSAAEQALALLPRSRVCAAFHHVSADLLADASVSRIDLDVLVLGDDRDTVAIVRALAAKINGMRGIYAGRLRNAHQVEAFTANLIAINKRYKAHAGIRVTDL